MNTAAQKTLAEESLADLGSIGDAPVAPAPAIAALALTLAMKYHDISTVQDGALYQQYKLEGKNLQPLSLDLVFDTAIQIEAHLLASSDRIAGLVVEALTFEDEDARDEEGRKP